MRAFIRYVCLLGFFGYATVSASSASGGHECCPASAGNSLPPSTFPFFERYNHRYITVHNNGSVIKLHYIHAGPKEGPVVVLIHGYPETLLEYRNQVPLLEKEGFQILAFDTRGIGGSEADGIDLHYNSISAATDIHLALKKLDLLKNKIHIVVSTLDAWVPSTIHRITVLIFILSYLQRDTTLAFHGLIFMLSCFLKTSILGLYLVYLLPAKLYVNHNPL